MQVGQVDQVFLICAGDQTHAGVGYFFQLGVHGGPLIERGNRPGDLGMNAGFDQGSARGVKHRLRRVKMFEQFTIGDISDPADQPQRQPRAPLCLMLSIRSSASPHFSTRER